jgi:hypothetical protein
MATTTTPITVERYREVTLPGDHKQLVEGEIVLDEPSFAHALLQGRVFTGLVEWVNSEPGFGTALFPTDIAIDEHNAFGPDVLWFADADHRPPQASTSRSRLSVARFCGLRCCPASAWRSTSCSRLRAGRLLPSKRRSPCTDQPTNEVDHCVSRRPIRI